MLRLIAAALAIALAASPAEARWRMATSENFVIYADDSARDVERFADMLERFHSSLEFLTGSPRHIPSPSNRVTVYVVGGERDIERLTGGSDYIAGFYLPRAGASSAFVQDVRFTTGEPHFSMILLLHEYAHHFIISRQPFAMPRWLSEGSAEFYASARFPRNGRIHIGRPARHRAGDLFYADQVSIRELLDDQLYAARENDGHDGFYGRAWLLYHYLALGGTRPGQLQEYSRLIAAGEPSLESAEQVFGDLDTLDEELDDYLRQRRMTMFNLAPEMIDQASVQVRELSDGMDAILPLMIRSRRGVSREQALELLPEIREVAQLYPQDPGVLAALAEAEYDAGNDAEAIDAADRAIALDPSTKNAYVQKGFALFRIAAEAEPEEMDAAYRLAMEPFAALNQLENDHPLPLIYFYRSYVERGEPPSDHAMDALEYAVQLSPFDQGLSMNLAVMLASQGRIAHSRQLLTTLAGNPHGGGLAEAARVYLASMRNAEEGEEYYLGQVVSGPADMFDPTKDGPDGEPDPDDSTDAPEATGEPGQDQPETQQQR